MNQKKNITLENNYVIKVDSLSKVYNLYSSPRDRLKETLHPRRKKYHKEFFALKDVSFIVEKGDSLGIVGQNGSGKSTLLKILSRVLTPTYGNYNIKGRVISLLELGAGFNPELTGIENVYFYATILGFSKKGIESKLDYILKFADIGEFVYQPLKTYSSGMRARLAFAVASHVDPDILILDEVLAVGDLRFKQKCMRSMKDLIDSDRTVILVSHDTDAVSRFCNKVLWLNQGTIQEYGSTSDVVKKYVSFMNYGLETNNLEKNKLVSSNTQIDGAKTKESSIKDLKFQEIKWTDVSKLESFGKFGAFIEKIAVYHKDSNKLVDVLKGGEWLSIFTQIKINSKILKPGLGIRFKDRLGNGVFTVNNYQFEMPLRELNVGELVVIQTNLKFPFLRNGKYIATIAISDGTQDDHVQHHWIHDAFIVTVNNDKIRFFNGAEIIVLEENCYTLSIVDK